MENNKVAKFEFNFGIYFIILLILKAAGGIDMPWIFVFIPMFLAFAVFLVVYTTNIWSLKNHVNSNQQ